MDEFYELTGRRYGRIRTWNIEKSDYVIVGMGSMVVQAHAVAEYLQKTRKLKVGILDVTMFRPFPGDLIGKVLKGKKGVVVLERTDQPLAEDLPLMREVRVRPFQVRGKRPGRWRAALGEVRNLSQLQGYPSNVFRSLWPGFP